MLKIKPFSFLIILIMLLSVSCTSKKVKPNPNLLEYSKALQTITVSLKQKYTESDQNPIKKKLAVLTFINENNLQSQLGRNISNGFQTYIYDKKFFTMLERERIDSLLSEYEFNDSGLVSSMDSIKLGQLLGAELVIVGTIAPNSNGEISYFTVTSRIVDLKSAEILGIAQIDIKSNQDLVAKYSTPLQKKIRDISGTYEIVLSNLIVTDSKSDGRAWDGDSTAPDIYVKISTNYSKDLKTSTYFDKTNIEGEFFKGNILLEKDDSILISVYDYDMLETDLIGKNYITNSQILEMLTNNKETVLSFGQVTSITISLKKK